MGSSDYDHKQTLGTVKEPLLFRNRINTDSQTAIVGANLCHIQSLDYEYVHIY